MSQPAYIVCVDDDPQVLSLLEHFLGEAGYKVKTVSSAFQARGALLRARPDLIVLDRRMPDVDGLKFLEEIRAQEHLKHVPVLFLTAEGSSDDKTEGINAGGDDYLAKPFSQKEFLARVGALLRRAQAPPLTPRLYFAKGIEVDLDRRRVEVNGKPVDVSGKEFSLLVALFERRGHVLGRQFLLERAWGLGKAEELNTKTVDVAVGRLRKALGAWGARIVAVPGEGYRLDAE